MGPDFQTFEKCRDSRMDIEIVDEVKIRRRKTLGAFINLIEWPVIIKGERT